MVIHPLHFPDLVVLGLQFKCVCVCVCRFYGRVCLSHLMTEPDFERIASRTLNTQQWSKMRDAVEMIRVKVCT